MTRPLREVIAEALYPLIEGVANSAYNGGGYAEYEAHEESFDFADAVIAALPQTEGSGELIGLREFIEQQLLNWDEAKEPTYERKLMARGARMALLDVRDDASKRIARQALALPVDGWRPIESAPKDRLAPRESLILVRTARGTYHTAFFDNYNGGTWWIAGTTIEIRPTHWMPLPPPPAPESGGEDG